MVGSGDKLSPGNDTDDRQIDQDVDDRDKNNADQDGARYDPSRILHLIADVADVIVAQIVVNADARGRAKADKKSERKVKRPGWKVERNPGVELSQPGNDYGRRGEEAADPQRDRQRPKRSDGPIQQGQVQNTDTRSHQRKLPRRQRGPQVAEILEKSDVPRCNLERAAQNELPDEQERREPSPRLAARDFAQTR